MSEPRGCQACGRDTPEGFMLSVIDSTPWAVSTILVGACLVQILLCPYCRFLPPDQVFDQYQTRVRRGNDPAYH